MNNFHVGLVDAMQIEQPAPRDVRDLYRRYGRIVYATAHHVLRHDDLAEEATERTFVHAARARERDDQDDDARGWLASIAMRAITDIHQREGHRSTTLADAASADSVWAIRRAIDVLPSIEATVVRLHHVEGLTHGQIAARLGLRVATVASTSRRAHLHLARALRATSRSRIAPTDQ